MSPRDLSIVIEYLRIINTYSVDSKLQSINYVMLSVISDPDNDI